MHYVDADLRQWGRVTVPAARVLKCDIVVREPPNDQPKRGRQKRTAPERKICTVFFEHLVAVQKLSDPFIFISYGIFINGYRASHFFPGLSQLVF